MYIYINYMYVCIYLLMYIYYNNYMYVCTYTHTSINSVMDSVCVCVCACIQIYIYIYTHTHTHIYIIFFSTTNLSSV